MELHIGRKTLKTGVVTGLLLFAAAGSAAERGGESPEATAARFQSAIEQRDVEQIAACLADTDRGFLLLLNLKSAIEFSTVLDPLDESFIRSPSFSVNDLPQDTEKRKSFVDIVKRNGIVLGGQSSPAGAEDLFTHFLNLAGPDPDRSIAELDAYNLRHLGRSNPTNQLLGMIAKPEFSEFDVSPSHATARMGDVRVNFVNVKGRWFLSNLVSIQVTPGKPGGADN